MALSKKEYDECASLSDMVPTDDLNSVFSFQDSSVYLVSPDQLYSLGTPDFFDSVSASHPHPHPHPRRHGKGKDLNLLRTKLLGLSSASCNNADYYSINDRKVGVSKNDNSSSDDNVKEINELESKLEGSKRKLKEGYGKCKQERKKTCLIDARSLPTQQQQQFSCNIASTSSLIKDECPMMKEKDELKSRLEISKRKLKEGYEKYKQQRKRTCVIDVRDIPPPLQQQQQQQQRKNQRGFFSKNNPGFMPKIIC